MGDAVWFFHHAGTQLGPLTWSELREHAGRGEIDADDLVWQPGMADWEPAATIEGLFAESSPEEGAGVPVEQEETPRQTWKPALAKRQKPSVPAPLRAAEGTLLALGRSLPAPNLDRVDRIAESAAQVAYLGAAALAMMCLVIVGIRASAPVLFVFAVASIPLALLLAYVTARFLTACRDRLDDAATALGSTVVLEGSAALLLSAGVLSAAMGIGFAVLGAGLIPVLVGLGILLVLVYGSAALLDASALNVTIRDGSSNTEEVIAAVAVFAKLFFLRLTPVILAAGSLAALFAAVGLVVMSLGDTGVEVWAAVIVWGRVLAVATIPVVAWGAFLVLWLPLGVARSLVLSSDTGSRESGTSRE
jgi:hypothetical protein